jgi:hypothetical protein
MVLGRCSQLAGDMRIPAGARLPDTGRALILLTAFRVAERGGAAG